MKKLLLSIFILSTILLYGCSNITTTNNTNGPKDCSTDAKEFFENYEYGIYGLDYQYQNHYNKKLNKCFVSMHANGIGGITNILWIDYILWDIYENKSIAQCEHTSDGIYDFCYFDDTNTKEKFSINKFNKFIKKYMEE